MILASLSSFILFIIQRIGYAGIFVLMALQSLNVPIPSEVTMPFSGFLAGQGVFSFWFVVFAGAFGSLAGSLISYQLASILLKNGYLEKHWTLKIIFDPEHIRWAEGWFKRYGHFSIFFGRLIPVLSTFISFPAGLAKMEIKRFAGLTFIGAFIWCFLLAWIGSVLGENWATLHTYFEKFEYVILFLIIVIIIGVVWHRVRGATALQRIDTNHE